MHNLNTKWLVFFREKSIPDLEGDTDVMSRLVMETGEREADLEIREIEVEECTPPRLCDEFQTARLFLSHFGFLHKLVSNIGALCGSSWATPAHL